MADNAGRCLGLGVAGALVMLALPATGLPIGVTTGVENKVNVRGEFTVTNNTGQDVNDLHLTIRAKEAGNAINGIKPTQAGPFGNYTANGVGGAAVRLEFDQGVVPDGGGVPVAVDTWLKFRNSLYVENVVFTLDGNPVGRANIDNGWRVDRPREGGAGGGGAGNIGGGGAGGQEGGGGNGFFIHQVFIENTGAKSAIVDDLRLLASMTRYASLSADIPWSSVDPIDLGGPQTLLPGEILAFSFETVGAYRDGHVYLRYDFIDDETIMFGDHPVTYVPVPANLLLLVSGVSMFGVTRRTRRRPAEA